MTEANSRVAFSRPGNMIRIPNIDNSMYRNLLTLDVSSEILSSYQNSSAFSIKTMSKSGYQFGLSIVKPVEPSNSVELGFHLQKNILLYGDVHLDAGIEDVLLRQIDDTTRSYGLDTKGVSFFTVLSSTKKFSYFAITTHLGFGSGKINEDSHMYVSNPKQNIGVFLGFNFKTPLLKKNGGISFLTEFDGKGLNLGIYVPLLNSTHINLGITHFEDFGNFATEDRKGNEWNEHRKGKGSKWYRQGFVSRDIKPSSAIFFPPIPANSIFGFNFFKECINTAA